MKTIERSAFIAVLLPLLLIAFSCEKPVNSIEFDPPPVPDGEQTLIINTAENNGSPITDVNISVSGPVDFSEIVPESRFTSPLLQGGLYTIKANKPGYLESVVAVNTRLPDNPSDESDFHANIYLTPQEPAIAVANQTGGTFQFAPGVYTRIEDIPITITIPPNALPGAGSTNIRINRILETDFNHSSTRTSTGSIGQDIIQIEPNGLRLNGPVTLNIPLNIPSPLIDDNFELYLHEVSRNSVSGRFNYETERVPVNVADDGSMGTAEVDKFASYRIVPNLQMTRQDSTSAFEEVIIGECGEPVTADFTLPTTNIGGLMRFLAPALQMNVENPSGKERSYEGMEGVAARVLARNRVSTWTISNQATGDELDQITVHSTPIEFRFERVTCFE